MGADLVLGRTAGADEVAGLDALELQRVEGPTLARRIWSATWPKLLAVGIFLGLWEAVTVAKVWPEYILPGPVAVFGELVRELQGPTLWNAVGITLRRGAWGFALAIVIGVGRHRIVVNGEHGPAPPRAAGR